MRRELAIAVVAMGAWCACYNNPATGSDATDAPTPVTIGFARSSSLVDERSGTITVPVVLSAATTSDVSVSYRFSGGTATPGADYNGSDGTITISAGQTMGGIELTILPDGIEEPDETIEITLYDPHGGDLGTSMHTITISANILPRVTFTQSMSSAMESANVMIDVQLDMTSPLPVSVDVALSGTATQGADYTFNAGTVTFPVGMTAQQIALGVVNDALNEDPETVILTLHDPVNGLLGATPSITHTIVDDDPEPSVTITTPSGSSPEATPTVTLTVSLSAPSGRTVTVPFSAAPASTAMAPDDYTYMTPSPLVFPAGTTTQTITIAVVNDTIDEPNETVITTLGTPTNATLGAAPSHTLTIIDDDLACYGTGNSMVCFDSGPTAPVQLSGTIDTGTSPLCSPTQAVGWTGNGQPAACFIVGTSITTSGTVSVRGTRPLVVVGSDTITISSALDVAAHRGGVGGPASPSGNCKAFAQNSGNSSSGGGGGAGASFMSGGGDGGKGDNGNTTNGIAATADGTAPTVLRAGCDGQKGGNGGGGNNAGVAGRGGGVVYLVAGNTITITSSGIINASGSSGTGGAIFTGGSGAGAGGMIKLYATTIAASGGTLFANGGGAASGGDQNNVGVSGNDPTNPLVRAAGGTGGGGGDGGAGFANAMSAVSGVQGGPNNGGGGGGGGGGYIEANLPLTGATVSAGLINAP